MRDDGCRRIRFRPGGEPGALHQPGAVLAAFQSPRAGGGRESSASAVREGPVPFDLGQQSRRILHGAGRRPQGPGARRHRGQEPGRADAERAACADRRGGLQPRQRSAGALAGAARGAQGREHRPGRCRQPEEGRSRLARGLFPAIHLPGADAACDRSGASVSVHSQSRLLDRVPARAHQRRQGDERAHPRAAEDRALHPPPDAPTAARCA